MQGGVQSLCSYILRRLLFPLFTSLQGNSYIGIIIGLIFRWFLHTILRPDYRSLIQIKTQGGVSVGGELVRSSSFSVYIQTYKMCFLSLFLDTQDVLKQLAIPLSFLLDRYLNSHDFPPSILLPNQFTVGKFVREG